MKVICLYCGKKIDNRSKFCEFCGKKYINPDRKKIKDLREKQEKRWWYRLFSVIYILLIMTSVGIGVIYFGEFAPYEYTNFCFYDNENCVPYSEMRGSWGEAWSVAIFSFVVAYVVIRLVKLAFLYITLGEKPMWREEFKRLC